MGKIGEIQIGAFLIEELHPPFPLEGGLGGCLPPQGGDGGVIKIQTPDQIWAAYQIGRWCSAYFRFDSKSMH